jgi:hypothetical protein
MLQGAFLFKEKADDHQKDEVKERLETAFEVYILLRKIAEFHDDTLHFLKRTATVDDPHNIDRRTLEYYYQNTASIEINQSGALQRVIFRESSHFPLHKFFSFSDSLTHSHNTINTLPCN